MDKQDSIRVSKTIDMVYNALEKEKTEYSDFLSPVVAAEVMRTLKEYGLTGYVNLIRFCDLCEYAVLRCGKEDEPDISVISLNINSERTTHRNILGKIMSLGISRDKIGDILAGNDNALILVKNTVLEVVLQEMGRLGGVNTSPVLVSALAMKEFNHEFKEEVITVSSSRLDLMISKSFRISRDKARALVEREKVKLNFMTDTRPDRRVEKGDLISVRGKGRIRIKEDLGTSSKGKLKYIIEIFK